MSKIHLDGSNTVSSWRAGMLPLLKFNGFECCDFVPDETCEISEDNCDWIIYCIAPDDDDVSMQEKLIELSEGHGGKVIFIALGMRSQPADRYKILVRLKKIVKSNGGAVFEDMVSAVLYIKDVDDLTVVE